jgi:aldose 1-epimerase
LLQTVLHNNNFNALVKGKETSLHFLENDFLEMVVTNYGATIVAIRVKNSNIPNQSIVAGFASLQDYINAGRSYYGCTVGRYANRIANAKFILNHVTYSLQNNDNGNTLHGGFDGLHNNVWDVDTSNSTQIKLRYISIDGEAGFPGNVHFLVTYCLEGSKVEINYTATTDADTIINCTNHSYFNLNGMGSSDVYQHLLSINAHSYLPINKNAIPKGQVAQVSNTPFDFLKEKSIGLDIDSDDEQQQFGKGYDHCYVLNSKGDINKIAATLTGDASGIQMNVYTTKPGMQLYTGNYMQGNQTFWNNTKDNFRTAVCLETQYFPNSPNNQQFINDIIVTPKQPYQHKTIYEFV